MSRWKQSKTIKIAYRRYLALFLAGNLAALMALPAPAAKAVTSSQLQQQINQHQQDLQDIQDQIDTLEEQQDLVEELIADLNAEIINTMTSIGLKEDEISEKEDELVEKEDEIELTEQEYAAAKEKEARQQEDMITRAQRMYETGNSNFLSSFLLKAGFGKVLNRMDYIEQVYEYDREKLLEFEETKLEVLSLWDRLEDEQSQLERDRQQLEQDRAALQEQKRTLDGMLAKKKAESANFDAEINQARQAASVQKKLIQQEMVKLKKLKQQEAAAAAAAAAAANGGTGASAGTSTGGNAASGDYNPVGYSDIINAASGSELGKKIARYACQYVGNPYVAGGTSLTNGADCSGFVWRVYSDFGYNLPRTSYEQRNAGSGVNYADAQPGDIICYDGHVALYIGGGKIVHASTQRTGIKVGNANYRTIIAVRRII